MKDEISTLTNLHDDLTKKSEQLRAGKLTDNQKWAIGIAGAALATGVIAVVLNKKLQAKIGIDAKESLRLNQETTVRQWRELFGTELSMSQGSGISNASFYSGLRSGKAFDRPEFVIPKTTLFQRLSNAEEDVAHYTKGAYSTFLENDKKIYGSSFEFGTSMHTIKFRPAEDVRVPSLKTVLAHLKQISPPGSTDEQVLAQYHALSGGQWSSSEQGQKLFSSLRGFGYSAIVDEMDAGYLGDLPVVFFGKVQEVAVEPRTSIDMLRDGQGILKQAGQFV